MKIEIWSDIVCPFCYIGKRRLEHALEKFPHKSDVEIEFKSFQLDPDSPLYNGENYYETLAERIGSVEQAKQMTAQTAAQAKLVGLDYNFDDMKATNTFDAHRLIQFARTKGKDYLVSEKLFHAYFTDSKDVGDLGTLADIAKDAGLDREEALGILEDKAQFSAEVHQDIDLAKQFGISGVPYFIINRKYAISGAQPEEVFTEALEKVWEEENPKPVFQDLSSSTDDGGTCTDGSCAVPPEVN